MPLAGWASLTEADKQTKHQRCAAPRINRAATARQAESRVGARAHTSTCTFQPRRPAAAGAAKMASQVAQRRQSKDRRLNVLRRSPVRAVAASAGVRGAELRGM